MLAGISFGNVTRHILFVINGTDFGGSESALFQIACRFRQRGHAVHVLSLKPIGRTGRMLGGAGIPVASLEMPESVSVAALVAGCWRLSKYLRQHRPHIVHAFLPRANIISRVAMKLARLNAAHLSSERSTDLKRGGAVTLLNRYTIRWTDRILAVSPEVKTVLAERDGVPEHKVSILSNGIDCERVDAAPPTDIRAELGLEKECVTLCSAGRLMPGKGHVYLIRAMAHMRTRDRVHLLVVGDGPEEARLQEEIASHGLFGRVHLLGYRSDLIGILKSVDVVVLPSLEEGIPVIVLEAMACARPVVATDVGGNRNLIVPGETGLLVPPAELWRSDGEGTSQRRTRRQDTEAAATTAMAEALDYLVTSPTIIADMGRRAKRRVEEAFALDRVVARLEHEYDALAAARSGNSAEPFNLWN